MVFKVIFVIQTPNYVLYGGVLYKTPFWVVIPQGDITEIFLYHVPYADYKPSLSKKAAD
jgi:hypothetical protein